jgi:hypothetical protein
MWTPIAGFITRVWRPRMPHLFADNAFVSQLANLLLHTTINSMRCTQSALQLLVSLLIANSAPSSSTAWVSLATITLACDRVTDVLSILIGTTQVEMACWHTSVKQLESDAVAILCDWSTFVQWCLAVSPETKHQLTDKQTRRIQFLDSLMAKLSSTSDHSEST